MKAVILAGGFATRLRPLSCTRPKILFPIVNKPLLQWTYERLARHEVTDIVLAVFQQTEVHIRQHHIPRSGLHITFSRDPLRKPLGTGGAIKRAEKHIGSDDSFFAMNGDTFADINYTEILKQHEKKDCTATIALYQVDDPSRYGVANVARNGLITRFMEKPLKSKATKSLINAGTYVFSPKIFKLIPENRRVSIEREVFPNLVKENELQAYVHQGLWSDIGKPADYMGLNRTMLKRNGLQDFKMRGVRIKNPVAFDGDVDVSKGSVIGPYTILGHGVRTGIDVEIANSILLPGTVVGDEAEVHDAIIGEDVRIGKRAKIGKDCIIGDHARIEDEVSLPTGTSVCPAEEVLGQGL